MDSDPIVQGFSRGVNREHDPLDPYFEDWVGFASIDDGPIFQDGELSYLSQTVLHNQRKQK